MHMLVHNQNFENKKSGIPKSPNQSYSSAVNKICPKKWSWRLIC
jgi:hypothetical protein